MARPKTERNETAIERNGTKRNPLVAELSELLRSIGAALGNAYAECDTPGAVIEHMEAAKVALLAARNGAKDGANG